MVRHASDQSGEWVIKVDIKILHDSVPYNEDYMDIDDLKFLKDNPRVYAVTHGERGFDQKLPEEQQEIIFQRLQNEASVKNLVPEIERHGGLIEPILVRRDTMEVIEGNSRLAAYRLLRDEGKSDDWEVIPCHLIKGLTEDQQAAYLNQIHVKGKTQWSAYEKANFAYVRSINGWLPQRIADVFGESVSTIRTRIKAVEMMKDSGDDAKTHFSYYDVLVRNADAVARMKEFPAFRDRLFEEIRRAPDNSEDDPTFTAQKLRDGLRDIVKKSKILTRYANGVIDFEEASGRAKVSPAEKRVKDASALVEEISITDVDGLPQNALNSLKQAVKKLDREVTRIRGMIGIGSAK